VSQSKISTTEALPSAFQALKQPLSSSSSSSSSSLGLQLRQLPRQVSSSDLALSTEQVGGAEPFVQFSPLPVSIFQLPLWRACPNM